MKTKVLLIGFILILSLVSCNNNSSSSNSTAEPFSIVGKWYTNPDDDRYYYQFNADGTYTHTYYEGPKVGEYPWNYRIKSENGYWSYNNDEHTMLSIRIRNWDSSNGFYYNGDFNSYEILEESDGKIILKSTDATTGTKLELYKNALNLMDSIPKEIVNLIGKWYYDESKTGEYFEFQADGICWHYYYSDSVITSTGTGGWTSKEGGWGYIESDKLLVVNMRGSVMDKYKIETLTDSVLVIAGRIFYK